MSDFPGRVAIYHRLTPGSESPGVHFELKGECHNRAKLGRWTRRWNRSFFIRSANHFFMSGSVKREEHGVSLEARNKEGGM